ncbi:MAG TPA: hypothetical protein VF270_00505 [Ignavibacteriaceae bacterium]
MNNLRFNKFGIIVLSLILIVATNSFSKSLLQDDKKISDFATTLKQKVLLNNNQETAVIDILSELQKNIASKPENKSDFIKDAQIKVEKLLDNKQKMKYDIIKNDIWKKFQ